MTPRRPMIVSERGDPWHQGHGSPRAGHERGAAGRAGLDLGERGGERGSAWPTGHEPGPIHDPRAMDTGAFAQVKALPGSGCLGLKGEPTAAGRFQGPRPRAPRRSGSPASRTASAPPARAIRVHRCMNPTASPTLQPPAPICGARTRPGPRGGRARRFVGGGFVVLGQRTPAPAAAAAERRGSTARRAAPSGRPVALRRPGRRHRGVLTPPPPPNRQPGRAPRRRVPDARTGPANRQGGPQARTCTRSDPARARSGCASTQ